MGDIHGASLRADSIGSAGVEGCRKAVLRTPTPVEQIGDELLIASMLAFLVEDGKVDAFLSNQKSRARESPKL